MINLDEVFIDRYGTKISIADLQKDVDAAIKKDFHPENDFAFTTATVQGLIDLVTDLLRKNAQLTADPIIHKSYFIGRYAYYFEKITNNAPTYMNLPIFNNIEEDEILAQNFLIALRLAKPTKELRFTQKAVKEGYVSLNLPGASGVTLDHLEMVADKNAICIHSAVWLAYIIFKQKDVDDDLKYNYHELLKNKNPYVRDLLTIATNMLTDLKD
jgi:hypothetical protein